MDINKEIKEILLTCQRDINILGEGNKFQILGSLNSLLKNVIFNSNINLENRKIIFEQYFSSKFIKLIDSPSDSIREITIENFYLIIKEFNNLNEGILEPIFIKFISRIREIPFKENSIIISRRIEIKYD